MPPHWETVNYFGALLFKNDVQSTSALEYLVDDLRQYKTLTVDSFLNNSGSEDFLWALVRFLGNSNARVAGNAAYILGTIAETIAGRRRVISLTESRHPEKMRILPDLTALLISEDYESVMNAAGTIGTLAESEEGRDWLLQEPRTPEMIDRVTQLLSHDNEWTASNAALVFARLSIAERGCEMILDNSNNTIILSKLIHSLSTDDSGKGLNAAFAIGRLCDLAKGRKMLLKLPECNKMVTQLGNMVCSDISHPRKNACFAVSCLAASKDGQERLLDSSMCDKVMTSLSQLLADPDEETGWFAAMTLRTISSWPSGCLRLRQLPKIVPSLQEALIACKGNDEIIKEVEETLAILKLLDKPSPPVATVLGPRKIHVTWARSETRCGLPVSYELLEDSTRVFFGNALETTLPDLSPGTTLNLRLQASVIGDESPLSDVVTVTTEEDVPHEPSNLSLLAKTATQLKIGWEPPTPMCGAIRAYHVYLGGVHVEHTTELSSIISGLKDETGYNVQVCASTSKGKGTRASLDCVTADLGDHCPSKPSLTIMGRSEINVTWNPPQVPLGRITRYDVSSNGKVFYSGTDLHCTAKYLTPNTEYTFVVTVITNEGPQKSKPAHKRTTKDEYDGQRLPLYIPPIRREEAKAELEAHLVAKRRKKRTALARAVSRDKITSATKSKKKSSFPDEIVTNLDKPDSAGFAGSSMESQPITTSQSHNAHSSTPSSFSTTATFDPRLSKEKIRTDQYRGENRYVTIGKPRSNSISGSTTSTNRQTVLSTSANRKTVSANPSNGKTISACLPNQKSAYSSHSSRASLKHQKTSVVCDEPQRLAKTLGSLNIATFEPMLPPKMHQRSSTFIGQRRQPSQQKPNQFTVVTHGNATPFTMEVPRNFSLNDPAGSHLGQPASQATKIYGSSPALQ